MSEKWQLALWAHCACNAIASVGSMVPFFAHVFLASVVNGQGAVPSVPSHFRSISHVFLVSLVKTFRLMCRCESLVYHS